MNTLTKVLLTVAVATTVLCLILLNDGRGTLLGSVAASNEYQATTTDANWGNYAGGKLITTGSGSVGSVIVTLTSNGTLELYDATTTTNHSDHATTSIAIFKTTTAGTYTFDAAFNRGLVVVMNNTVGVASTTITWRK